MALLNSKILQNLSASVKSHILQDILQSSMELPCISGALVTLKCPVVNKFLPCFLCPNRLCTDNHENLFVGDVCELATTKRQKDFYNNNTKSQCKSLSATHNQENMDVTMQDLNI